VALGNIFTVFEIFIQGVPFGASGNLIAGKFCQSTRELLATCQVFRNETRLPCGMIFPLNSHTFLFMDFILLFKPSARAFVTPFLIAHSMQNK